MNALLEYLKTNIKQNPEDFAAKLDEQDQVSLGALKALAIAEFSRSREMNYRSIIIEINGRLED